MKERYIIKRENENSYIFTTESKIEYQMIIKYSEITYKDIQNNVINVPDLALNCDLNTVIKDYKTSRTIAFFCSKLTLNYEALLLQIHNQPEKLENNKIERRGVLRIKLWNRVINRYFKDFVMFTNQILDPHPESDIFCIVLKKDSSHYNEVLSNFYSFCHSKMYK